MLAEMYQQYLDNNRWQFQNRTQTVDFKKTRTSALGRWSNWWPKAINFFWASLKNNAIKTISIDDYKLLLNEGENDERLRPTLFDFLAHRAIDHFTNERNYLTQPAYKFNIDDEKAFAPAKEFANWRINTKDTASQKYQTLLLFQGLLRFQGFGKNDALTLAFGCRPETLVVCPHQFCERGQGRVLPASIAKFKSQIRRKQRRCRCEPCHRQPLLFKGTRLQKSSFWAD